MKIVNTDYINDHEVKLLGMVKGIGVQLNNSELYQTDVYTQLIEQAYSQALESMVSEASQRQADGIINVKVDTEVTGGIAQVFIYGTAVRYKENYAVQQF